MKANFRHIWWDCYVIKPFWKLIGQEVEMIMGQRIPFTLGTYLLHNFSDTDITTSMKLLLLNLCTAATLLITYRWKSAEVLKKHQWLGKIRYILLMCKLTAIVKYKLGNDSVKFKNQWVLFRQYY